MKGYANMKRLFNTSHWRSSALARPTNKMTLLRGLPSVMMYPITSSLRSQI